MKKFILALASIAALVACGNRSHGPLLPNVTGKAGEVLVVIDRDNWDGPLGAQIKDTLGGQCPYLAQNEPLFSLMHVAPAGLAEMFKIHRNILIINTSASPDNEGVVYRNNVYARPQCIIQLNASSHESAQELFAQNGTRIAAAIEQAERDRVIENSTLYEEASLRTPVAALAGGYMHFPMGYKLKKATDSFVWIADEKQYSTQGVFVYKYPAGEVDNFSTENIIAHRNAILELNVPGMFDNTYMITSEYARPRVEFIRFRGRQFAQCRGLWEVHNDFMGGPFVSHSFYGPDGKDIIVVEAWVYAPRYDKRQYLRQVESILYSFEWLPEYQAEKKN